MNSRVNQDLLFLLGENADGLFKISSLWRTNTPERLMLGKDKFFFSFSLLGEHAS
jgi:hypothetical protein